MQKRRNTAIPDGLDWLHVRNFRSFQDFRIVFGRFTAIVGPNASGKTNLLDSLQFLSTTAKHGLDEAIAELGGLRSIAHIKHPNDPVTLECRFRDTDLLKAIDLFVEFDHAEIDFSNPTATYTLSIDMSGSVARVLQDELVLTVDAIGKGTRLDTATPQSATLKFSKNDENRSYNVDWHFESSIESTVSQLSTIFQNAKRTSSADVILAQNVSLLDFEFGRFFKDIQIFDFDPHIMRDAVAITGNAQLDSDGENIAAVLRSISLDKKNAARFNQLIKSVLPFISNMRAEGFSDDTAILAVEDKHAGHAFQAHLLSSGTMYLASLIAALYFTDAPFLIFEEPDRYLHAGIISKICELFESRSQFRQVLITTHNSDMIRAIDPNNVYAIFRNNRGYSTAFKPIDDEYIAAFLSNSIDVADLNRDRALLTKSQTD